MFNKMKSVDSAIHNLASLIVMSSKDRALKIEIKRKAPIGCLDNGINADKLIDDMMKSLGQPLNKQSEQEIPHINDTPIPKEIFADVMKCIGEIYTKDRSELKLRKI